MHSAYQEGVGVSGGYPCLAGAVAGASLVGFNGQ